MPYELVGKEQVMQNSITNRPYQIDPKMYSTGNINKKPRAAFGVGVGSGAVAGASLGGLPGALIGGVIGLGSDIANHFLNRRATRKANEDAEKSAEAAFMRNQNAQTAANMQNLPASQVAQLRAAGLSPGLALQHMQPSLAGAASSAPAQSFQQAPDQLDGRGMYENFLNAVQTESLVNLQTSEVAKNSAETVATDIDNLTLHQRNIATLQQILSSASLSDAQKERIKTLLMYEVEQSIQTTENLKAHTNKLNVEAKYIAEAQTANTEANTKYVSGAQTKLSNAQARQANSQALLNEEYEPAHIKAQTNEATEHADLMNMTRKEIKQRYDLRESTIQGLENFLSRHGWSKNYLGLAVSFCENVAEQSGKTLPDVSFKTLCSWLSGDNWISYMSSNNVANINKESAENVANIHAQSAETVANIHKEASENVANVNAQNRLDVADKWINEVYNKAKKDESLTRSEHDYCEKARETYKKLKPLYKEKVVEYSKVHSPLETAKYTNELYNTQRFLKN